MTNWGAGTVRHEFLHVDDMAVAIVLLLESYDSSETINLGTGVDQTIAEVAVMVAEAVGYEGRTSWDASKPDGTPRKLLDVGRLTDLGWRSHISLEDAVRSTVAWYVAHRDTISP